MLGLILTSHGNLIYGIIDTYKIVIGNFPKEIKVISLGLNNDINTFEAELVKKIEELKDTKGIIILTDLEGGSPYNIAFKHSLREKHSTNIRVISGLNLPMLIEATENIENSDFEKAVKSTITEGMMGIKLAKINSMKDFEEEEF